MRVFGYVSAVALCVLVGAMGMLILSQGVQADSVGGMRAPLYFIKAQLVNDYMQYHGRQIQSYYVSVSEPDYYALVTVVPPGKRFIVTDYVSSKSHHLSTIASSSGSKFLANVGNTVPGEYVPHIALNSGVAFEAEESIYIVGSPYAHGGASISGYYVDMPQP